MSFLILELSDADEWPSPAWAPGQLIPDRRRPSMLQPDRETAEREALRLADRYPGGRFVVFAPVTQGVTVKVPTHVTMAGKAVVERNQAVLVAIKEAGEVDDDLPF